MAVGERGAVGLAIERADGVDIRDVVGKRENKMRAAGVKPLILGPGSLETAHTPDEQVMFADVAIAARMYAALCLGTVTGSHS